MELATAWRPREIHTSRHRGTGNLSMNSEYLEALVSFRPFVAARKRLLPRAARRAR